MTVRVKQHIKGSGSGSGSDSLEIICLSRFDLIDSDFVCTSDGVEQLFTFPLGMHLAWRTAGAENFATIKANQFQPQAVHQNL